jgi:hypothetical protein
MPGQAERDVMGVMLTANAQAAAEVLHRTADADEGSVIAAIAATRSLSLIVEDTLRALVAQARAEGRTWAEVGAVLRVTRQAAFQRFRPSMPAGEASVDAPPLDGAAVRAVTLLENLLAERWEVVEKDLTPKMAELLPRELLQSTRARLVRQWGTLSGLGDATVAVSDGLTVVDLPLAFERQDASCRVVYTSEGQIAGLLWRPT